MRARIQQIFHAIILYAKQAREGDAGISQGRGHITLLGCRDEAPLRRLHIRATGDHVGRREQNTFDE